MTDLSSLRIAEDRIEWAVLDDAGDAWDYPSREAAERVARRDGCPLVSRRVIVTQWADAQC